MVSRSERPAPTPIEPSARRPSSRAVRVAQAERQPAFDPVVPLSPSQPQTYPQPPPWQLFPQHLGDQGRLTTRWSTSSSTPKRRRPADSWPERASIPTSACSVTSSSKSKTSTWRWPGSWEDIRNGTAWRGEGQRFRLEASPGSEVQRYIVSLQDPFFTPTISLGMSGSFYDRRYVDWDEQRIGGRVSIGRQWTERDIAVTFAYRGENINIHDPAIPTPPSSRKCSATTRCTVSAWRPRTTPATAHSLPRAATSSKCRSSKSSARFDYPRAILDVRQYFLLHERPDRSGRHVLGLRHASRVHGLAHADLRTLLCRRNIDDARFRLSAGRRRSTALCPRRRRVHVDQHA